MDIFWYHFIRWSEVWGLFIPLAIIICYKIKVAEMQPLIIYFWVALVLNSISMSISEFRYAMPPFMKNNTSIYNLHTVIRVLLLGWYVSKTSLLNPIRIFKFVLPAYILLVILYFSFIKSPLEFSSEMSSFEAITLLMLCISYFLLSIRDDSDTIWMEHPSFIICSVISFYEAINFFIFLFFAAIHKQSHSFGEITMMIFSICYVILCATLAYVFYRNKEQLPPRRQLTT